MPEEDVFVRIEYLADGLYVLLISCSTDLLEEVYSYN
jgi:hypothetical protein